MCAPAPASFFSTRETTNYARLCRLLVDVGSQALRDTFDYIHPPGTLHTVLSNHHVHATLQVLRKRKLLNPIQWGKLYPAIPSRVSSTSFDITLLMLLLRNICGLTHPATGWDHFPPVADTSIEADITRMKYFRNTVYGHANQASVDDATFNTYWQDIQDALIRLGGRSYGYSINALKTECMDPDIEGHYRELLMNWKKDEDSLKGQLVEMEDNIRDDLEKMKNEIGSINRKLDNLSASREAVNDEAKDDQSARKRTSMDADERGRSADERGATSDVSSQDLAERGNDTSDKHEEKTVNQERQSEDKHLKAGARDQENDSKKVSRCNPRPRGVAGRDTSYEKGSVLDAEENRELEFKSLVSAQPCSLPWKIMEKAKKFICACLNNDRNGIIYFGVGDSKEQGSKYKHGEILGLEVEDIRDDVNKAFQFVLDDHINSDAGPLQKGGEQNCINIHFVPVKSQGNRTNLYVIEIEVARDWRFCKDNVYYSKTWTEKRGDKDCAKKKALSDFFKVKDEFDDVAIRTNGASSCVKKHEVNRQVRKPLEVKYKEWRQKDKHGSGDAEGSIVTAGNSNSTTVNNSAMSTNSNPLGSGSSTAVFAGANIGTIQHCTFQIYHCNTPTNIEERQRLPDLSD